MQRYPTFSVRGHLPRRLVDGDDPSAAISASSSAQVGNHHGEFYAHQSNTRHLPTSISSSTGELQVSGGVAISPFTESDYVPVSTSGSALQFVGDRSQYISSSRSHAATFRHYESHVCCGANHTLSSNFYSTSSHYSQRSVLTMPASAASSYRVPGRPSAVSAATSRSLTAAQHKQNVIEVSKPFESSDVLRYSEKLRRQRLNDSAMAAAEFFNLSH